MANTTDENAARADDLWITRLPRSPQPSNERLRARVCRWLTITPMTSPGRGPFPAEALEWALPAAGSTLLTLGAPAPSLARLLGEAHPLTVVDKRTGPLQRIAPAVPARLVAAQAESLPFVSANFDAVLVNQNLHRFAPGLALAEIARVLRPGGRLAVLYTVRDDSVPWVKRLINIMRGANAEAMRGAYGMESISVVEDCRYYPTLESRDFRMWVPVTRPELLRMVSADRSVQDLPAEARQRLIDDVALLYDNSARPPEPLLLPYRIRAWRTQVDHDELTAPITALDEGLAISL